MRLRDRKLRLGIVLAIAVTAAVFAWRTGQNGATPKCEPGRVEERDAAGTVTKVVRTTCL
ncbi:hypothetical protein [Sphingomonas hengshuiensis]|uniref:hypothetical protein n=1 Tax=Sphingomonas hengshuiensis TaxID=1609977 RepID=UPI000A586F52|nr:hypothetical protein [Sphingomonas hengshuiensis]